MPFDRTVLLPYDLLKDLGGNIKNLVARFPDDVDAGDTIDTLMSRFSINVYATLDGRTYLVKTASSQSIEGFWKMLLPVLLIVLIMVNIMLGTVDERREEIKMLGAVGLAPRHVSILYLAEACVFGVLGVVFGVILGLVVSWATRGVNVGVDVNYASVPTMMMGFLVLVIVVVATLIPAARAARLATPSGAGKWVLPESRSGDTVLALPFTVTRDNGVGIFAFLHEYLSGHSESTSPDFRCSDLEAGIVPLGRDDSELVIRSRVWLAPYDMRVSQDVTLALHRQPGLPLFSVRYEAHKTTGELSAWHRANYTFVDLLRRQFLIFRTLGDENKTAYVERAASVFAPTLAPPAVSRPPSSAPESEAAPALS
jgi:energy-coupling factor transporter transmembrane protein EcfT